MIIGKKCDLCGKGENLNLFGDGTHYGLIFHEKCVQEIIANPDLFSNNKMEYVIKLHLKIKEYREERNKKLLQVAVLDGFNWDVDQKLNKNTAQGSNYENK